MKDDADDVPQPRTEPAHTVPEVDLIDAPASPDGPTPDGEDHPVALPKRHDFRPGLHPGPLLGHHELPSGEIAARLGQQNRDLQREHVLTIDVLVKTVVVPGRIAEQQRRRACLPDRVTARERKTKASAQGSHR